MRPNVDIPWSLHGQVREVADRHELDLDEAYIRLIQRGIATDQEHIESILVRTLLSTDAYIELRDDIDSIVGFLEAADGFGEVSS